MAPALTEDEAREIMAKILEQLKVTATQMIRAAEGIKQKIAQQGQEIEDRKLMQMFILPHFETAFQQLQEKILDEYEVEEYELEDAVNTYIAEGDKKLSETAERIRMIYKEFGGGIDDADESENSLTSPAGAGASELNLDKVVAILEDIMVNMEEKCSQFFEAYMAQHGSPRTKEQINNFQMQLMYISES